MAKTLVLSSRCVSHSRQNADTRDAVPRSFASVILRAITSCSAIALHRSLIGHLRLCRELCFHPVNVGLTHTRLVAMPTDSQAVWYAAEAFGDIVGLAKGGGARASAATADVQPISREKAMAMLREDYSVNYFISGKGEMTAYDPQVDVLRFHRMFCAVAVAAPPLTACSPRSRSASSQIRSCPSRASTASRRTCPTLAAS